MPSLFPPLSLSLFIYPLPSFVSVLIERTFLPPFRETARKNIKSTRILMIPRACRIGNGSMFRRGLPERSLRGGGGTNFPVESPENLLRHRRSAYKSPVPGTKNLGGSLAIEMDGACTRRRGSRGIEKRGASPSSTPLSLSLTLDDREEEDLGRRGGRGRERAREGWRGMKRQAFAA